MILCSPSPGTELSLNTTLKMERESERERESASRISKSCREVHFKCGAPEVLPSTVASLCSGTFFALDPHAQLRKGKKSVHAEALHS